MAFRLLTSHKALIFQIVSSDLKIDDAESCRKEILNNKSLYSLIMLDLSKVQSVDLNALKILADLGRTLQIEKTSRLMVIGDEAMVRMIREKDYSEVLPCYVGVVPVPISGDEVNIPKEITTQEFFNVTLPAIKENLRTYAKMNVSFSSPSVCSQKDRPVVDIAGVGGFFCNHRKGSLMLCFKQESYVKIVSAIMKKEFVKIEPLITDWSAELVNSILGRVKSDLRSAGYTFSAGIPTVFSGKDLEVFYSTKLPAKLDFVRCTGDFGEFFVELILTNMDT